MPRHETVLLRADQGPRWRLALLVTVLAGFFLMHGLSSGNSCAGAALRPIDTHGTVAMTSADTDSASASASAAAAAAIGGDSLSPTSPIDQCCAATGTLCVPQRPQDEAWLLVSLLLGLAVLPTGAIAARLTAPRPRAARTGRRHLGTAMPVHLFVCVCRT